MVIAQNSDPELQHLRIDSSIKLQAVALAMLDSTIICRVYWGFQTACSKEFHHTVFTSLHHLSHPRIRATKCLITGCYILPHIKSDIRLITACYIWPRIKSDVRQWARICLKQRYTYIPPYPSALSPLQMLDLTTFTLISLDHSLLPEAILITDSTAQRVARAFGYLTLVSPPLSYRSWTAGEFDLWRSLLKLFGTQHVHTTSYGLVERFYRQLKGALEANQHPDTGLRYYQ